jgi:hypothetical protein
VTFKPRTVKMNHNTLTAECLSVAEYSVNSQDGFLQVPIVFSGSHALGKVHGIGPAEAPLHRPDHPPDGTFRIWDARLNH